MDAVPFIAETNYHLNEPELPGCHQNDTNDCLNHIYTMNVQLTHNVLDSFDSVLREDQFNKTRLVPLFFLSHLTGVLFIGEIEKIALVRKM